MKESLINNELRLYSFQEVSQLLKMNRNKFINNYVATGKVAVTLLENGERKIAHEDLRDYLGTRKRVGQISINN